jgi:hypothetical protein
VRPPYSSLPLILLLAVSCAAPAPPPPPTTRPQPTRPAPTSTPTPNAATTALAIVPLRIDEATVPPADPTPVGFTSGRATPTPAATAEAAWKYLTITFAVENRSDQPHLLGIGGSDSTETNLAGAILTTRDGSRYKPVRSTTSFGLRTATAHSLTTYPVLLRLPSHFRVASESAGTVSVVAPDLSTVTFKVPATVSAYAMLTIPPMGNLGPRSGEDDVTRALRPLIGGFQPLDLTDATIGPRAVTFPSEGASAEPMGTPVSIAGKLSVNLVKVDSTDPADYEIRNRGWKQVTLSLQYRNDDPQQTRAFNVAAWLFGEDGTVYTGDAPTIGDLGRSLTAPDVSTLWLWDGRLAGTDPVPAGQSSEPRRATFLVPRELRNGMLVLTGDVDATYKVSDIPVPPPRP